MFSNKFGVLCITFLAFEFFCFQCSNALAPSKKSLFRKRSENSQLADMSPINRNLTGEIRGDVPILPVYDERNYSDEDLIGMDLGREN